MGWWQRLVPGGREVPPGTPLAALAKAPLPDPQTPLGLVELLAVDLETTGLDPRRDELLSVGMVVVRGGQVHLGTARHLPVRPRGQVGDSAVVHGLTDDALAQAPTIEQVLPQVLAALVHVTPPPGAAADAADHHDPAAAPRPRRVLLAHFAQVETTFLAAACRQVYGASVGVPVADTLEIARRLLRAHHHELQAGTVRLDACRRRHGLPRYRAHSAVTDAVACAELFLAQTAELEQVRGRPLVLADVLERGLR
ncbi:exonuclease domain-containing protein [Ornithinimicrobium sufpigmenti]|uniref:exonuclease domain-containing protein n=1 Tax=Ornithinimicrobium sufpigmenti TaxID=2508882 RepID=UPI0010356C79|nr:MULTISPECIES: exonuclease domain-containing protein [unclassified Ornithinimicrobium]